MIRSAALGTIFRWIHILFSIPIIGYVYSRFDKIPHYAHPTRFFFVPINDPYGTLDVVALSAVD